MGLKTPMIEVSKVSKQYKGTDFYSLKEVSLSIQKGEVYGLLGPNGAGKTTLISILCGLISQSAGNIAIAGNNFKQDTRTIQKMIGVVPQEYALYPKLTARENLLYFGSMFGLSKSTLQAEITMHLDELGLLHFADKRISTFSGGMKRRINLIAGILHQPELLFLDEPTVGVDVQSKQAITAKLNALNASGTTILYTSHHLREAQDFCTRVGIIDGGVIVVEDTPKKLIETTEDARNLEDVFIARTGKELRDYA